MNNIALYSVQPILSAGLQAALAASNAFRLSPVCESLAQLVEQIRVTEPALVLIELTRDVTLEVLKHIRSQAPDAPIILWVDTVSTEFAAQSIGLGIRGILRRCLSLELQLKCLQKVSEGELWIEKALSDMLLSSKRVSLTSRERQLMGLVAQGLKNKEIAFSLGITEGTVKVYLSRLFEKVGAADRLELALFTIRNIAALGLSEEWKCHPDEISRAVPLYLPAFVSRPTEAKLQV